MLATFDSDFTRRRHNIRVEDGWKH